MLDFAKNLYEELLQKLNNQGPARELRVFPYQRLAWITNSLDQLREKLWDYIFLDEQEEIVFFKVHLPRFLSLFIYYKEKSILDALLFVSTATSRIKYLERVSARIELFVEGNIDFISYYCDGETSRDTEFFHGHSIDGTDFIAMDMESSFGAPYSLKLAKILAYSRLGKEMQQAVEGPKDRAQKEIVSNNILPWTGDKIELVELAYSLHENKAFKGGKASLKEIVRFFEVGCSIELGNISSSFQQIMTRKTGYTLYLDRLKDGVNARIDKIERGHIKGQ